MELVGALKYLSVFLDRENELLEGVWNENNADITNEEIKQATIDTTRLIKLYSPKYFLASESNRQFPYSVDIQQWVGACYAEACISVGVKKFAMVMPTELIAQLSTEQTRDEAGILPFEVQDFDDRETALRWLKS